MMKHFTLTLLALAAIALPNLAQNKVKNIYSWQEKLNIAALTNPAQPTQLCRTLYAGYNSICLPMSLSPSELKEAAADVQIERLAAIRQEGDVLSLLFLDCTAEGLQAGVPYLIYSPTTQTLRAQTGTNVDTQLKPVTMRDASGDNQVTFASSWESLRIEGRYGIPAQQDATVLQSVLIRTEADKTFLPTRCGFTWDKQAPSAVRMEVKHVTTLDDTAAIDKLKAENAVVDVYDVQGKLVRAASPINTLLSTLPQGIYVINGQKVILK